MEDRFSFAFSFQLSERPPCHEVGALIRTASEIPSYRLLEDTAATEPRREMRVRKTDSRQPLKH